MSNTARKVDHIDDYRAIKSTYNKPSRVESHHSIGDAIKSAFSRFESSGGGNMDNYITRPEFEEHKSHLDSRFDAIAKDITIAKNEAIEKIEVTRKSDKRWFIGLMVPTLLSVLGMALKIFGII